MSNHRPHYPRRDSPPPPPPPDMSPLPRVPPLPSRSYQFGTGPSQIGRDGPSSMQQAGFSFQANHHAPQYPTNYEAYRPSYADAQRDAQNEYRLSQASHNIRGDHHHGSNRGRRGDRGYRGPHRARPTFQPSSRPLLQASGGKSPEVNPEGPGEGSEFQRYRNADEMSDSDEVIDDKLGGQSDDSLMADAEEYEPTFESHGLLTLPGTTSNGNQSGNDGVQIQTTAAESSASVNSSKAGSVPPKWSNPEYLTVLPPPDDSLRKKKDVVKLIRKARVASAKPDEQENQVVANDDFISLNFDEGSSTTEAMGTMVSNAMGQEAPTASQRSQQRNPQVFRQVQPSDAVAPGVECSALTASQLGPPPNGHVTTAVETVAARQKRPRESEDEEEVLIPRPPKKAKGKRNFSNGRVLDEWRMDRAKNPVPWLLTGAQVPTINPGQRLHHEICDFYSFVKPQEYEHIIRTDMLDRLRRTIRFYQPECELRCFGSFAAGLYLPNADMDLVIVSRKFMMTGIPRVFRNATQMHALANYLSQKGITDANSIEVVAKAKVPIVKFVDQVTNLKVDISFENDSGLIANDTFQRWRAEHPAMPILVVLIKQFLMMRGLNEVVQGGIGGFSVTCLVVSLLQNLPRVQCGEIVPEQHLGEMLLEFLDFYGNQLDISRTGLSLNPPGYFAKPFHPSKLDRIAIMDPNRPDNDISGGSRNITVVFAAFSECHAEILRAMRTPESKSLLSWMLGGNYNSILWQRQRLRRLYRENYGQGVPGGGLIRDPSPEESRCTGLEAGKGSSNTEKDSKPSSRDGTLQFVERQLKELKCIKQCKTMADYVRTATPSGNEALLQSILEKEKPLLVETFKYEKDLTEHPKLRALRCKILKLWNPKDSTPEDQVRKRQFDSARISYQKIYVLLQELLDLSPQPDWQKAFVFGKRSQNRLSTEYLQTGSQNKGHRIAETEDAPWIKQESDTEILGPRKTALPGILSDAQSHSDNASLKQQGSSTEDAIMID